MTPYRCFQQTQTVFRLSQTTHYHLFILVEVRSVAPLHWIMGVETAVVSIVNRCLECHQLSTSTVVSIPHISHLPSHIAIILLSHLFSSSSIINIARVVIIHQGIRSLILHPKRNETIPHFIIINEVPSVQHRIQWLHRVLVQFKNTEVVHAGSSNAIGLRQTDKEDSNRQSHVPSVPSRFVPSAHSEHGITRFGSNYTALESIESITHSSQTRLPVFLVCIGRAFVCKQIQLTHAQMDILDVAYTTQSLEEAIACFGST